MLRSFLLATSILIAVPLQAQEVTLKLHQFLPASSTIPAKVLRPWAEQITRASAGRIEVQFFDAMALGGKPNELIDQARDGVVDLIMTLPGYTPGRFPKSEVFELPFMMTSPEATAMAYWELIDTQLQDEEFRDVQVLGGWVHGPGVIHTREAVNTVADLDGMKVRGPTRVINDLLGELGATPVGMPVPAVPEAVSKGVIDGAVIPWEVTRALKLSELVSHHIEFETDAALYTAVFVLAMNKPRYDALPEDLRAIIDAASGLEFSAMAAREMLTADAPARELAVAAGNTIVTVNEASAGDWRAAAQPVIDRWVTGLKKDQDIDGEALIEQARSLIGQHGG